MLQKQAHMAIQFQLREGPTPLHRLKHTASATIHLTIGLKLSHVVEDGVQKHVSY